MAERRSALSFTALRCETAPQATASRSTILSSGSTNFGHVGSTVFSSASKSDSYNSSTPIKTRTCINSRFPTQNNSIEETNDQEKTIQNTHRFLEQRTDSGADVFGLDQIERREVEVPEQRITLGVRHFHGAGRSRNAERPYGLRRRRRRASELSTGRPAERGMASARAEKAGGKGGRPEGTGTGFEGARGVKRERRFEKRGFTEADGLEMDRPRERKEGSHEKN